MIKYSSYTNQLQFFLCYHYNKILPNDVQLNNKTKTKQSKTILQRPVKLLLQQRTHINHVISDSLLESIQRLKGRILNT